MSKNKKLVLLLLAVAVVALIIAERHRINFDFRAFLQQLRLVDLRRIAAATALIYATFIFRGFRWSIFMRALKPTHGLALVGPQFIGFTAVAIFGRIADLSRPYLLAQKTRTPLAAQIAIYTVERMFDLGAAALIFSSALALMPRDMPHHEIFVRVGVGSLAGTLLLAAFCVIMRMAGDKVATTARRMAAGLSPTFAENLQNKLLAFRDGLNAVASLKDFLLTAALSLTMWGGIAFAYLLTANAFVATPQLADLTFSRAMLLMAASIGGSLLQLPIIGWFTQIAATAAAMHAFYGAPLEPATACGALLLIVTFISIIPAGLIFARIGRVRIGDLTDAEVTASPEGAQ